MAILKIVHHKDLGPKSFSKAVKYVSNPIKTGDNDTVKQAKAFEDLSYLNRYFYGQEDRIRWFKHCIISLEANWSDNVSERMICRANLKKGY